MHESDRITAGGDLISINSECSPQNKTMSDEDIRSLDLGNSSETISFNSSQDYGLPTQKYQQAHESEKEKNETIG